MKKVLLALLAVLPFTFLSTQNCVPDTAYQDSTGVFPMPFDADNPSPNDGINECAVIGEEFEFVFTVGVGDSITIPGAPPAPLDKVEVLEVLNLPTGINYLCEPTNCTFEKNSIGCVVLSGIPTASNTPMVFELEIKVNVHIDGLPFPIPLTFPDDQLAPGVYSLQLLADGSQPCDVVSTKEELSDKLQMTVQPNPTAGPLNIEITADVFGEFNLHIVDLLGRSVYDQVVRVNNGFNNFNLDASPLSNGLYFLVLENELGRVAQRITIQH